MTDRPIPAGLTATDELAELDRVLDTAWLAETTADHVAATALANVPWEITGDNTAEWALRRVAEARATVAERAGMAAAWKAEVDAWLAVETRRALATEAFFVGHLTRYALDCREADPKRKSVSLPSGKVQTREPKPKAVVIDARAVAAWVRESLPEIADAAIRESILISVLGEHVTAYVDEDGHGHVVTDSGEVVPGMAVEQGETTASVQT